MQGVLNLELSRIQAIGLIALFSAGCGIIKPATTTCNAGTAQINVFDGSMSRGCGCAEGSGGSFTNQSLICTVSEGTRMYFQYTNINVAHNITFSSFGYGPLHQDPSSSGNSNPTDAITLNSTGTVTFVDSSDGVGGTIISQ